jgi:hypothetical protein
MISQRVKETYNRQDSIVSFDQDPGRVGLLKRQLMKFREMRLRGGVPSRHQRRFRVLRARQAVMVAMGEYVETEVNGMRKLGRSHWWDLPRGAEQD